MARAISRVTRSVARKPIETIAFCTILVICGCCFLWQTIRQDELFAGKRSLFPAHTINYSRSDSARFNVAQHPSLAASQGDSIDIFAVSIHAQAPTTRKQKQAFRKNIAEIQRIYEQLGSEAFGDSSEQRIAFGDVCARDPASQRCVALSPIRGDVGELLAAGKSTQELFDPKLGFLRGTADVPATTLVFALRTSNGEQAARADAWVRAARRLASAQLQALSASKQGERPPARTVLLRIADRVYRLLREATVGEVLLVFMSYAITISTFINTFVTMRRYGSQITLALSVIFSGFCAFVFAIATVHLLGYPINAVLLTEALPFLIICVGFDKSLTLTRSVLLAAYSDRQRSGSNAGRRAKDARSNTPAQIQAQIARGVDKCATQLVKDYLFEISILAIGVCSGVPQLHEVCLISSFILLFEGVFMFTLYAAILTLKLDLIRVRSELKLASSTNSSRADDDADEVAKDASPALYKKIALKALSDDEARSENKTIRQLKTLVLGGFILISCIESSGYMSGAFSLKSLFSNTRSDSLVEATRFPMLDRIAAPLVSLISDMAAAAAAADGAAVQQPLRVHILPVASWFLDSAGGSAAAAASLGAVDGLDGSSVVIGLLALAVIASLGVNIYLACFRTASAATGTAARGGSAAMPAAFDSLLRNGG
ncbi:3-hydroxy-3-methylglutaryl-coenzyme A (HMG-CoA) reductase isozyme, partial [Coemansia sp. RSA 2704]